MKLAADKRQHAKPSGITSGDKVLVRQQKQNKLSTPFWPKPLVVTATKGSMVTARKPDGSTVTRNPALFRKLPNSVQPALPQEEDDEEDEDVETTEAVARSSVEGPAVTPRKQPSQPTSPNPIQNSYSSPKTIPKLRYQAQSQSQPLLPTRKSTRCTRKPDYLRDFVTK